jgi:hypothetical protein
MDVLDVWIVDFSTVLRSTSGHHYYYGVDGVCAQMILSSISISNDLDQVTPTNRENPS